MAVGFHIVDGFGGSHKVHVTDDHELLTITSGYPPLMPQRIRPFVQFLTDDGLSTGSQDMLVDGSSTAVDFWIPAAEDDDRYVTTLAVLIADAGAKLRLFGALSALTNGVRLFYTSSHGEQDIIAAAKTNFEFIRFALGNPPISPGAGKAFIISDVIAANDEAVLPVLDLRTIMPPFGIKLDAGSNQKIVATVRDNLSAGMTQLDIIAYGFDRFK